MRAYIIPSGVRVEPFHDPAAECLIGNRPLAEWQEAVLRRLGFEVRRVGTPSEIEDTEYFLFLDHVFFSKGVVERFRDAVLGKGENRVLALAVGPFTRFTLPIQDTGPEPAAGGADPAAGIVPYGIYYAARPSSLEELRAAPRAVVPLKEREFPVDLSTFGARGQSLRIPIPNGVVMHLTHWVHLWLANLFSIGLVWTETARRRWAWVAWTVVRSLFALDRFRMFHGLLRRLVVRGKGCNIHPSAVVEGSILGKNVSIGALSMVRFSILGDGAVVSDQATVSGSVLGPKAIVAQQGIINLTAVGPESFVKTLQGAMIGRKAFVAGRVRFYDLKLEGKISVLSEGKLVETSLNFLSGCVGHEASVSGPVWVYYGRAIPNGIRVIQPPDQVLSRIPADARPGSFYVNRGGVLTDLAEARKKGPSTGGGGPD